ncbi:MAG: hypothetical protein KIT02_13250 [Devosia sp.]|uniref:hypothetical protein n=1 Tax=Devosia sp. TaxID=1871048 RepID=UPI0024CACE79|nr:hypothetical protein [Devosia sp.]UYN98890.1 MAG: hypothetical protein KIT02_13250 [Devosia sp.]
MEFPALATGGVTPTLPILLVVFVVLALAGAMLLLLALLRRNLLLVGKRRLNPFSPADVQRAADPGLSTRRAGQVPFWQTLYARLALMLLVTGLSGVIVMTLVQLFSS